ncbi:MAG: hemolysin III family protein [Clostridia bacterium]|nr:hemolysin III family protein [Clostridia bacterium]
MENTVKKSSVKKKQGISIPNYTLGEEIFNAVSHGLGGLLSVAALILMLVRAKTPLAAVSAAVFGCAMTVLYTVSCVYHALSRRVKGKQVLRVIDHCNVFFLVLGTYVPVSLLGVGGWLGWTLLGIVSAFAAAGISLNGVNMERFKRASVVCHLVCGWMILAGVPALLRTAGRAGVYWLLAGGAAYTVGSVLYGIGAKKQYIHSVFHVFCLIGTACHFWAVYQYLL